MSLWRVATWRSMVPPILTLILLVFAFAFGFRGPQSRSGLRTIAVAWLVVTVVNFVVAGVADDDDVPAFFFSALILLLLTYLLWRLGGWLRRRTA